MHHYSVINTLKKTYFSDINLFRTLSFLHQLIISTFNLRTRQMSRDINHRTAPTRFFASIFEATTIIFCLQCCIPKVKDYEVFLFLFSILFFISCWVSFVIHIKTHSLFSPRAIALLWDLFPSAPQWCTAAVLPLLTGCCSKASA